MTNKYDELLIEGLSKLKELEFSHIPEADKIDHTFSKEYVKSKEKLLNKLGTSYWKYVNTIAKKAAVIIITLIISFSSLMTVDAFREKVVDFVYTIYSTFTKVSSSNNTDKNMHITNFFTINTIPKGYTKRSFIQQSKRRIFTYWINNNDRYIMLMQTNLLDTNQFNSEHGELNEVIINDTPCLVCEHNTDYFCFWEFDDYRFELIYPVDLGEEFMSEVVGNLVEIDPAELEN